MMFQQFYSGECVVFLRLVYAWRPGYCGDARCSDRARRKAPADAFAAR